MKALILAAGTASRLRPLTAHTPKCLLQIGGRTLLGRSIDALRAAGVRDFVFVTGYLHEQIEQFVGRTYGADLRATFVHNADYASTNNIYSLWLARDAVAGAPFLLLDSDLLYAPDIVRAVLDEPADNVLTLIRHPLGEEEMKVVCGTDGQIVEISKTCRPADAAGESLGIEKIGTRYAAALYAELAPMMRSEGLAGTFYELAFQRLIAKGHTFHILDATRWPSCELDTVEDFERAQREWE